MIKLKSDPDCEPLYMSLHSAGADLRARESQTLASGQRVKVPVGVWIDEVEWEKIPEGLVPELQIRARSGLSFKHGLMLPNGVGTVDADYPDEICVLLWNSSDSPYTIEKGERVAQMIVNLVYQLPSVEKCGSRQGGFGSTGR